MRTSKINYVGWVFEIDYQRLSKIVPGTSVHTCESINRWICLNFHQIFWPLMGWIEGSNLKFNLFSVNLKLLTFFLCGNI